MKSQYETDYFKWAMETASALREGRFQDIDIEATAEEIEDLGKSERRSLHGALVHLFMHLLKVKYQPQLATVSWQVSIEKQHLAIADILEENPSLKALLKDARFMDKVYRRAVLDAILETGLPKETFPAVSPFTIADTKTKAAVKRKR